MPYGVQYTNQSIPPWLEKLSRAALERSAVHSTWEYPTYHGTRLAPYANPDITRSEELGRKTGLFQPYADKASQFVRDAETRFPAAVQNYMNPYLQHVVDYLGEHAQRNWQERILPALSAHFESLGQHGSSRHADLARRAARDVNESLLREQNLARSQAFEKAANVFATDQMRALEAANAYTNLGKIAQATNLADVAALREQGESQKQHEQTKANLGYEDTWRQRNYLDQQLDKHIANLQGVPHSTQGIGVNQLPTQPTPQTNTAGRIGEIAGSLIGAHRAGIFKKGGTVSSQQKPSKHCFGMTSLRFIASKSKPKAKRVMRGRV